MGKVSKADRKRHDEAMELVELDRKLTYDEKIFVLENYQESIGNYIQGTGSFFTPLKLSQEFSIYVNATKSVVDICAGIGHLSWGIVRACEFSSFTINLTCIEINPEYVKVGKKIIPEANWICADVTDINTWKDLGSFHVAISNPPFGKIKTGANTMPLSYSGSEFELKAIEISAIVAEYGAFLLPQSSTPYAYSGAESRKDDFGQVTSPIPERSPKYKKFNEETNLDLEFNSGSDCGAFEKAWKNTSVMVEIVLSDLYNANQFNEIEEYNTV